jgi:hypothetical protein
LAKNTAPNAHPKPFNPNIAPSRAILDVLLHDNSRAVLKGPASSQALKTMTVQRERLKDGKTGEDSHHQFNAGWKTGSPWLDFRKMTTTDHDSAGNSVLVTVMFCKWCEMAGFKHNNRGKPTVQTGDVGGCQRAKLESVKDHEVTQTHKEAANLQMNQRDMKETIKTAILQHNHMLLNLTSIILSMVNNHDSLASFSARCLAAEMLSVEVKTKGED